MSIALLKEFIKLAVSESPMARVPNQLLSPEESEDGKKDGSPEPTADQVQEFSGVGSIMGYSLPLGMNPDAAGRQMNRPRRKKKK